MSGSRTALVGRVAAPLWRPGARAASWGVGAAAQALARRAGAEVTDVEGPESPDGSRPRLRVCAGAGRGAPCARGGTTWGHVFVTRRPLAALDAGTVRHELVHVAQWRRWGALFPLLYVLAELRGGPLHNRFEIAAGLRDGGYLR